MSHEERDLPMLERASGTTPPLPPATDLAPPPVESAGPGGLSGNPL
jgi:hypothetical protein